MSEKVPQFSMYHRLAQALPKVLATPGGMAQMDFFDLLPEEGDEYMEFCEALRQGRIPSDLFGLIYKNFLDLAYKIQKENLADIDDVSVRDGVFNNMIPRSMRMIIGMTRKTQPSVAKVNERLLEVFERERPILRKIFDRAIGDARLTLLQEAIRVSIRHVDPKDKLSD